MIDALQVQKLKEMCGKSLLELKLHNLPEGKRWVALGQRWYVDGRKHDMPCGIGENPEEALRQLLSFINEPA